MENNMIINIAHLLHICIFNDDPRNNLNKKTYPWYYAARCKWDKNN